MANSINYKNGKVEINYQGSLDLPELAAYLKKVTAEKGSGQSVKVHAFEQALLLGSIALNSGEVARFISEIERGLSEKLSPLRLLVKEVEVEEAGSQSKGEKAELEIEDVLQRINKEMGFEDQIEVVGGKSADGKIIGTKARKFGDVLCHLGGTESKLVFESKMAKSDSMGDLTKLSMQNALGQVKGSQANRNSRFSVFVTPLNSRVHGSMDGKKLKVDFANCAIFAAIDRSSGDFSGLEAAYVVGRALTLGSAWPDIQQQHLRSVAALFSKSLSAVSALGTTIDSIRTSAKSIQIDAEKLSSDFVEERQLLDATLNYLRAVQRSTDSDEIDLKLREIQLLTGEEYSKK